jgi:hypothetical protein
MDFSDTATTKNWFASEVNEMESIFFYSFVQKENVDEIFQLVSKLNAVQQPLSQIRIAVLNIEKSTDQMQ